MTDVDAAAFKQNDVAFFRKVADADEQFAAMEEAAAPHGGLAALAGRLGVAEQFVQLLWGVPRVREKLAVLDFCLTFNDDAALADVRTPCHFLHSLLSPPPALVVWRQE